MKIPYPYYGALICLEGHIISITASDFSKSTDVKFCERCGKKTITNCPNCNADIRGFDYDKHIKSEDYKLPHFCPDCSKPYPWTKSKVSAAKKFAEEVENLTKEERKLLKKSIDDIIQDSQDTSVAVVRLKKILIKMGKESGTILKDIIVDIASETIKKQIGL